MRGELSSSDSSDFRTPSRFSMTSFVPDPDHPITESLQVVVAPFILAVFRVLAAVELDNQTPLEADEVDVVAVDRLLANEFEASGLSGADTRPQRKLCRCGGAPQ